MLIAALGASAVSQLYQSLTGQGSGSGAATSTTAPKPKAPAPAPAAPALSEPAKKLIGDLNTFLLDLQASATGAKAAGAPGAAAGNTAGSVPPSPLQIKLQKLNEALGKIDGAHPHHVHHQAAPTDEPAGSAPGNAAPTSRGVLAQIAKAFDAYGANTRGAAAQAGLAL